MWHIIFFFKAKLYKSYGFTGVQYTFSVRKSMTEWSFQKFEILLWCYSIIYQQLKHLNVSYRAKDSTPQKWCTWNSCLSQSIRGYGSFRGSFFFFTTGRKHMVDSVLWKLSTCSSDLTQTCWNIFFLYNYTR